MAALLSLAEAKAYLNKTDTADDAEMAGYIDAVTAIVERETGEVTTQRTIVEQRIIPRAVNRLALLSGPIISLTSVVHLDNLGTWAPTDFHVNKPAALLTLTFGRQVLWGNVEITYEAGYAVIPPHYKIAAAVIFGHIWEHQRLSIAGAGSSPPIPGWGDSAGPVQFGYSIPNAAAELLGRASVIGGFA